MDTYLQASKSRTAFELADAIDRRYTSDDRFRTKFIRAELYQASEAAERFIRFFELKKTLFGVNLLTKDILLEHLNEDDMEALKSGGLQLCPLTDTAGRPIVSIMLGLRKYKEPENMVCRNGIVALVFIALRCPMLMVVLAATSLLLHLHGVVQG
jgi:hypothetical protein